MVKKIGALERFQYSQCQSRYQSCKDHERNIKKINQESQKSLIFKEFENKNCSARLRTGIPLIKPCRKKHVVYGLVVLPLLAWNYLNLKTCVL